MNRTPNHSASDSGSNSDSNSTDAIDRLLAAQANVPGEQLVPSSGFVLSVMEAVHAEASEPPPLAFPWRRVLPGAIASLCGVAVFAIFLLRGWGAAAMVHPAALPPHESLALSLIPSLTGGELMLCWTVVAACLSIAAIAGSLRLTSRSR